MKASREEAAASRERILDTASKRFRERGFDGIGVADLMKDAGLTHGGFYGHFASKEDLIAQTCERSLAQSVQRWQRLCAREDGDALRALAKSYLSMRHLDDPGTGCAIASLGIDASRHAAPVRHAMSNGIRALVAILTPLVQGRTRAAKRRKALATYASMVGAIVLARAVDDPAMSREILDAVTASVEAAAG